MKMKEFSMYGEIKEIFAKAMQEARAKELAARALFVATKPKTEKKHA